jgi:hypothetical protein
MLKLHSIIWTPLGVYQIRVSGHLSAGEYHGGTIKSGTLLDGMA